MQAFKIDVSQAVLDDLKTRLASARLPDDPANDWSKGMNPSYLRELVTHWRDRFDWRQQEAKLNRFRQFLTTVDGTCIHFIYERGRGSHPMPLLLTHGFPDSFFRFSKLIPLLTDPASHGADERDSFDVIVPSLPGYAFSQAREDHGGLFGFGDLWHKLMTGPLGYAAFAAHGGDWGSSVTEHLSRNHSSSVIAIHLTDVPFWHIFQKPSDLSDSEQRYIERNERWQREDGAYAMIQGTRPRTAAAGLFDSPPGLAAWIVEKFQEWSDCDNNIETRFSKDELLTNIMLYWVTNTIGSSFQPYSDIVSAGAMRWMKEAAKNWIGSAPTPAAFALFPKDISHPPSAWAERFFNVQRWTEMPRGGHFAALEEPELLAQDMRDFLRPYRLPTTR
jgi:pimeloyl-ACP methyl ester carboxylesterase